MSQLNKQVEFFCRQICDQLDVDPDALIHGTELKEWTAHEFMVRDWLVNEAFRKVRDKNWDGEARKNLVNNAVVKTTS